MEMNDTKLIAAVAEKLGWIYEPDDEGAQFFHPACWKHQPNGKLPWKTICPADQLPTTDQCLALLAQKGLMATLEVWPRQHQNIATVYMPEEGPFFTGKDSESLPRAILLAILEVPNEG